jgi:hypothetical protein
MRYWAGAWALILLAVFGTAASAQQPKLNRLGQQPRTIYNGEITISEPAVYGNTGRVVPPYTADLADNTPTDLTVSFGALLKAGDTWGCIMVSLEVEVIPATQQFTGTPNLQGGYNENCWNNISMKSCLPLEANRVTFKPAANVKYKYRARLNMTQKGAFTNGSSWSCNDGMRTSFQTDWVNPKDSDQQVAQWSFQFLPVPITTLALRDGLAQFCSQLVDDDNPHDFDAPDSPSKKFIHFKAVQKAANNCGPNEFRLTVPLATMDRFNSTAGVLFVALQSDAACKLTISTFRVLPGEPEFALKTVDLKPGVVDVEQIPIAHEPNGRIRDLSEFLFTVGERPPGPVHFANAITSFQFKCVGNNQPPNLAFRTLSLFYDTTVFASDTTAANSLPGAKSLPAHPKPVPAPLRAR